MIPSCISSWPYCPLVFSVLRNSYDLNHASPASCLVRILSVQSQDMASRTAPSISALGGEVPSLRSTKQYVQSQDWASSFQASWTFRLWRKKGTWGRLCRDESPLRGARHQNILLFDPPDLAAETPQQYLFLVNFFLSCLCIWRRSIPISHCCTGHFVLAGTGAHPTC